MSWSGDPDDPRPDEHPTERFPVRPVPDVPAEPPYGSPSDEELDPPSGSALGVSSGPLRGRSSGRRYGEWADPDYDADAGSMEEPRRFTPLLAAAAAVAVVAVLALLVVVLSAGGDPARSPIAGSGPPGQPTGALGTAEGDASLTGSDGSPAIGLPPLAEIVCKDPVDGFARARASLIQAFREECASALDAVLATEGIDPVQVIEAAWAYGVDDTGAQGAGPLSEVYLVLEGERRVRFYVVSLDPEAGDALVVGGMARVRQIGETVVFRWSRDAV